MQNAKQILFGFIFLFFILGKSVIENNINCDVLLSFCVQCQEKINKTTTMHTHQFLSTHTNHILIFIHSYSFSKHFQVLPTE